MVIVQFQFHYACIVACKMLIFRVHALQLGPCGGVLQSLLCHCVLQEDYIHSIVKVMHHYSFVQIILTINNNAQLYHEIATAK